MKNVYKFILCFAVIGFIFSSCSNDDSQNVETAGFSVDLVDAPGDYDEVLVDVKGIEIIVNEETLDFDVAEAGVYDLLELTGGISAMLVDTEIPAGNLSQIRLVLGEDNTVVIDGEEFTLDTPSAQQSGLKLNVHEDLEPGIKYEFILDFNVEESVVVLGDNQGYILKPVIRTTTVAESGAISGVVSPAEVQSLVTASDGTTEVSAYTNAETGEFLLYGVPEGTYTVTVEPDSESEFSSTTIENIEVEKGATVDIGEITLE